jgi:hypothetical protein
MVPWPLRDAAGLTWTPAPDVRVPWPLIEAAGETVFWPWAVRVPWPEREAASACRTPPAAGGALAPDLAGFGGGGSGGLGWGPGTKANRNVARTADHTTELDRVALAVWVALLLTTSSIIEQLALLVLVSSVPNDGELIVAAAFWKAPTTSS